MKLRLNYILLLITFAIAANADNLGYSANKPLVFGIDQDYPPLEYIDKDGKPSGIDVEFTKRLMKRLDIPMKFKPNTWGAIAGDVLHGRVDLGMMVFSPYRQNQTNYSRAVMRLYYQLVTRTGERKNYGLRDVEGLEIALMQSRPVVDTLAKSGAKIVVIENLTEAIKDLAAGKYDAVICYRYQSKHIIQDNHLTNLEAEDLTLTPREYCYVSHNKQLIDRINQELDKMEKEGVIDEVYADVAANFDGLIIPRWVWYASACLLIVTLLGIILMQKKNQRKLKKALELARENEERAKANEERAKANEEKAKANEEKAKANEEKAKANEEAARKSEELKDIFLGNMSHSLRTPLNAIIGFSDLLLTMDDESMTREDRDNLLQLINKNGLDLLHMVNELLSLSDIEGSKQLFQREVTDVDYEMGLYANEIRMQLHEGVTLEVVEPVEGLRALVDKKLMKMVTMHLLENAMQHTKEGKITLTYYVKEGGMYVEVKDTGDGLPEKLKENIFGLLSDKNTYTHDENQDNPGLGLSVCKAVIDRSNGKIGARDNTEDGRGTIFWYWAPTEILN
ncbi:MAG: transporter substrate-binding domain-containing protein [Prevotella sp.]|nr:transporter substrate-binding domain-containing protein [Prevotella sp.]